MEQLEFNSILLLVVIGGTIGGIAEFCRQLRFSDVQAILSARAHKHGVDSTGKNTVSGADEDVSTDRSRFSINETFLAWWHVAPLVITNVIIGICGAIAVQFALVLLRSFRSTGSVDDQIFILSISTAAGFAARRILPSLSDRLESQVAQVRINTEEASRISQEANRLSQEAGKRAQEAGKEADEAVFFAKVQDALKANANPSTRFYCIAKIKKSLQENPLQREYTIMLGRLLRANDNYHGAVEVLENFVAKKNIEDKDVADVLFNIACYKSQQWDRMGSEQDKKEAVSALVRSIRLSPENVKDAVNDTDIAPIREQEQVRSIIDEYRDVLEAN